VLEPDPHPPELAVIEPSRRGAQVVVAVMHPSLSESLCELLRAIGLEATAAPSAEQIVQELASSPAAVLIDAAWSREAMVLSQTSSVPMALVTARSSGGTQMVAHNRLPILLRPARRDGLLRVLAGLWGSGGNTNRLLRQASPAIESGQVPPQNIAKNTESPAELDYTPSADILQRTPIRAPAPVAKPVPIAMPMLAGGLQGGLRAGIDAVREAARIGDLASVRRAAQGLRSAAEPLGLTELANTCIALEGAVSTGDRGAVVCIAGNLDDIRRRAQQEITQMCRGADKPADH